MFQPGGLNVNLNLGNQGIQGFPGHFGCHGPRPGGGQGQMLRMMQMMLQLMSRMMGGGGQQCGCCPNSRPNFGCGAPFQGAQAGFSMQMGASIRGFLG